MRECVRFSPSLWEKKKRKSERPKKKVTYKNYLLPAIQKRFRFYVCAWPSSANCEHPTEIPSMKESTCIFSCFEVIIYVNFGTDSQMNTRSFDKFSSTCSRLVVANRRWLGWQRWCARGDIKMSSEIRKSEKFSKTCKKKVRSRGV